MRFAAIHKLASYLMVAAATFSLILVPDISFTAALLAVLGIAASWFAEPPRYPLQRLAVAWNIATVLFLVYLVVAVLGGESLVSAGVHLLLFVLVNKLFNRKNSKDYQQAYVVSLLMLVAATTLNTSLSYAVCFVLFVVSATWALILWHLRKEMEDNYLLKHTAGAQSEKVQVERILNSRRIVGGRFLAGTSLLSLSVLGGAALLFVAFPRVGFGLLAGQRRGGATLVGFSERVTLGHHGTIRDNPQIVMRVQVTAAARQQWPPAKLLWRGSAFDHYQDGIWSHAPRLRGRRQSVSPAEGLYRMNHAPGLPLAASADAIRRDLLRQEIYLEPLESTLLFAVDRPVAVVVPPRKVDGRAPFVPLRGPLGEIRIRKPSVAAAAVRYVAYSQPVRPSPERMRRAGPPPTDPALARFLQLPDSLPERVRRLARQITAGRDTVYDKVLAIERHLQRSYRYTLQLQHDPRLEPVDEFLFVTRAGHCEYFASAMALMLRSVGIHARNVNGFAGGSFNTYGGYWVVRQGDAHAWTEVLLAGLGWVAFDPTPPGAAPAGAVHAAAWRQKLAQMVDTLRMRWLRHVVEYDLDQQLSLLTRFEQLLGGERRRGGGGGDRWRRPVAVGLGLGLVAVAIALLVRGRQRWRPLLAQHRAAGAGAHPASALYRRATSLIRRRTGQIRPQPMTPAEFAAVLQRARVSGASEIDRLTHAYYQARYSSDRPPPEQLVRLRELVDDLRQQLGHPSRPDGEPDDADEAARGDPRRRGEP